MQIGGDTIKFKSTPDMYIKEESGTKQNTVRILHGDELKELKGSSPTRITITRTTDPFRCFNRHLSDITKIGEILGGEMYVFSWRDDETQSE